MTQDSSPVLVHLVPRGIPGIDVVRRRFLLSVVCLAGVYVLLHACSYID